MTDWKNIQNSDGGWAYNKGCSWTEPTAFALLAQTATRIDRPSFEAGIKFLRSTQRKDGGWSPQPDVAESTWVTALPALLPEEALGADRMKRALGWLENQTGRESSTSFRFQQWIHGVHENNPAGWPWFPGAAAWVIPTSLGILAFERALARGENRRLRERVDLAREFLVYHMCADGGWNHGSSRALGRDGDSYPETTGIGLAALRPSVDGKYAQAISRAKSAAMRHLVNCRTAEGVSWLRIGLAAHGESASASPARPLTPRTTVDAALLAISSAPRNPLLPADQSLARFRNGCASGQIPVLACPADSGV